MMRHRGKTEKHEESTGVLWGPFQAVFLHVIGREGGGIKIIWKNVQKFSKLMKMPRKSTNSSPRHKKVHQSTS